MERVHGTFSREFTLPPDVDAEHIKAKVENGVLRVEMPRTKEAVAGEKSIAVE
jgi:HSP20 family protein